MWKGKKMPGLMGLKTITQEGIRVRVAVNSLSLPLRHRGLSLAVPAAVQSGPEA